jgi:hypothetical protein
MLRGTDQKRTRMPYKRLRGACKTYGTYGPKGMVTARRKYTDKLRLRK